MVVVCHITNINLLVILFIALSSKSAAQPFIHSFIHSCSHWLVTSHSVIQSLTHLLTHSVNHSLTNSLTHSLCVPVLAGSIYWCGYRKIYKRRCDIAICWIWCLTTITFIYQINYDSKRWQNGLFYIDI